MNKVIILEKGVPAIDVNIVLESFWVSDGDSRFPLCFFFFPSYPTEKPRHFSFLEFVFSRTVSVSNN